MAMCRWCAVSRSATSNVSENVLESRSQLATAGSSLSGGFGNCASTTGAAQAEKSRLLKQMSRTNSPLETVVEVGIANTRGIRGRVTARATPEHACPFYH
jgi:hypothetical protein